MTALTRMAVMLRIYVDDLRDRREQGDQMVGWVLAIIAVIVLILSYWPDLGLLSIMPGANAATVGALMLMHTLTAAVIAAIFAMNEYLFTLIIATQKAYPLSVALANFSGGSDGIIYNAIALVAFLAFFPALLLVILIQNHLSRGLTMGAVKG